jgi:hypothetical protein
VLDRDPGGGPCPRPGIARVDPGEGTAGGSDQGFTEDHRAFLDSGLAFALRKGIPAGGADGSAQSRAGGAAISEPGSGAVEYVELCE